MIYCSRLKVNISSQVSKEKKKKHSKLTTIKKKLSRSKRHGKSHHYGKAMREMLSSWSCARDIHTLVADYEATLALKELSYQADSARVRAPSYMDDLGTLYDAQNFTDVDLIYKNTVFPVHRAIVALRCPFFRELLARFPQRCARVPVTIRTPGVSVAIFSALLRYLYTGHFHSTDDLDKNLNLLIQLADEFGTPNPLEIDMKTLLDTGVYSDAVLVFPSPTDIDSSSSGAECASSSSSSSRHSRRLEIKCHKAVLAARSTFFRKLLIRRSRAAANGDASRNSHTCIVLDETVIPRKYARILLNALYLDAVDMTCIVRSSISACSLSEVQAMVAGKANVTELDEAMEVYQIAQFLEFPVLAQGKLLSHSLPTSHSWSLVHVSVVNLADQVAKRSSVRSWKWTRWRRF